MNSKRYIHTTSSKIVEGKVKEKERGKRPYHFVIDFVIEVQVEV